MNCSIIISTWNNADIVKRTLNEFEKCVPVTDIDWEIVVVNNNSTDDTATVVQSFADKLPLKYVEEPQQGLSKARNKGLRNASGELIIFTDDDVFPAADWIVNYWKAYCAHKENYYFGGSIYSVYEDESKVDKDLVEWAPPSVKGMNLGDTQHEIKKPEFFISANWACPKRYLDRAGGFDETLGLGSSGKKVVTSEETALMDGLTASGVTPLYLPSVTIGHCVPIAKTQFKHIMDRKKASGEAYARLRFQYKGEPLLCGVPRWMYKKLFMKCVYYIYNRVRGRKAYMQYADFIYMIGLMQGLRKRKLIRYGST